MEERVLFLINVQDEVATGRCPRLQGIDDLAYLGIPEMKEYDPAKIKVVLDETVLRHPQLEAFLPDVYTSEFNSEEILECLFSLNTPYVAFYYAKNVGDGVLDPEDLRKYFEYTEVFSNRRFAPRYDSEEDLLLFSSIWQKLNLQEETFKGSSGYLTPIEEPYLLV